MIMNRRLLGDEQNQISGYGPVDYGELRFLLRIARQVKRHYDQRADDRCWADDVELYKTAGLETGPDLFQVGDKVAMRNNCDRYIDKRCLGGGGWKSYAELEQENKRLREELEKITSGEK